VVFDYTGLYEIVLNPLDPRVCSFFIDLHQAAVARDIAYNDRSETARRRLARWLTSRLEVANLGHGSDWLS
jgi:hypothetical protein